MAGRTRPIQVTAETRLGEVLEEAASGPILLEKDGDLYALSPLGNGSANSDLYTQEQIGQCIWDDALDEEAEAVARRFGWNAKPQ